MINFSTCGKIRLRASKYVAISIKPPGPQNYAPERKNPRYTGIVWIAVPIIDIFMILEHF